MELGVFTFVPTGDVAPPQVMRDLMEQAALADQVGLDVFGVGEHHRPDYLVSAPAVVLAAMAERTRRIRLSSAVTVLSSDDPVRVFQDFATLDLISGGRAEIMAGRGSFIESFPLFGQDLSDYDALFAEKLELLLQLREQEVVSWRGTHRPAIEGRGVYPRPVQNPLPVWIAVGGTPQSAVRAGTLGLPMALAIIGGEPERFAGFVALYRESGLRAGHDASRLKVGINSHGYIAADSKQAADEWYPSHAEVMTRIGRERGWPPETRAHFEQSRGPKGALLVGTPQEVVDKILFEHEIFRMDRFNMQMSVGSVPHLQVMRSIELFGTIVAPAVRKAVAAGE